MKAGKTEEAFRIFRKIGGDDYAERERTKITDTISQYEHLPFKVLFSKGLAPVLILGIGLAVFQQWCGINVIFNYAEEIFTSAGYGISGTLLNIVLTGIVNLVFTVVAMFLVDRWCRKALMLLGAGGLAIVYVIIATGYYMNLTGFFMLFWIIVAISVYTLTLAPITWVLLSEIFPNRIRGHAMSVATFALWVACAVFTITFPFLHKGLGVSRTFIVYAVICVIGFFGLLKKLPETKQKSLEQIEKELTS